MYCTQKVFRVCQGDGPWAPSRPCSFSLPPEAARAGLCPISICCPSHYPLWVPWLLQVRLEQREFRGYSPGSAASSVLGKPPELLGLAFPLSGPVVQELFPVQCLAGLVTHEHSDPLPPPWGNRGALPLSHLAQATLPSPFIP